MEQQKLFRMPARSRNRKAGPTVKDNRKIAVAGTGRGSGVSLVTGLLAARAAARAPEEAVTLAELGTPYFYEAFGIGKRFLHRDFFPFYSMMAQRRSIKGLSNTEEGINWALRCPGECSPREAPSAPVSDRLRLIHNLSGTLLLFDCSGMAGDALWEILPEMDALIFVVDPLPSTLIPQAGLIERIRLESPDALWVVNKMNRGVHKGELKRFLGGVPCLEIPFLAPEELYRAQYNCQLPYCLPSVRQKAEPALQALWQGVEGFGPLRSR